jgi:sortase A
VLSTLLLVSGAALLGWALLVWQWQDPFTYLLMQREQRALAQRYEERVASYGPVNANLGEGSTLAAKARRYRRASGRGEPIARIRVPKLDVNLVVVNGTDSGTLKKGPGRHLSSFMPGEGELAYVAGHRTTYGAPFSHIDKLERGDPITVELPYATFEYAVTGRRIVDASYVQALKSRGREELALQACWPRFFASQRIIVYATPVAVTARPTRG